MAYPFPDPIPATDAAILAAKALSGRVTVGDESVLVKLSNDWRAGGEVVVVLRNVTSATPRSLSERPVDGAPYQSYPVTVKSKRSRRLDLLDPILINHDGRIPTQAPMCTRHNLLLGLEISLGCVPEIKMTNVDGDQFYGPDQIARDFTIMDDVVYEGETDKTFRVTHTAKGPMYSILTTADDGTTTIIVDTTKQASIAITIPNELQSVPLDACQH